MVSSQKVRPEVASVSLPAFTTENRHEEQAGPRAKGARAEVTRNLSKFLMCKVQKKVLDALEEELQMVVSCHVDVSLLHA